MKNNIKLSICVCSVLNRRNNFLPSILQQLYDQVSKFDDVEVLVLIDHKLKMLGDKRNDLITISQGRYVVAVDDDDKLSDNYVEELRNAIINNDGVDVINFIVAVSINNSAYKNCYYSKDFEDKNTNDAYYRLPNHISCVKRSLALQTPFKPIVRGEDFAFAQDLKNKIITEYNINKVLYYYNFSTATTETQKKL